MGGARPGGEPAPALGTLSAPDQAEATISHHGPEKLQWNNSAVGDTGPKAPTARLFPGPSQKCGSSFTKGPSSDGPKANLGQLVSIIELLRCSLPSAGTEDY